MKKQTFAVIHFDVRPLKIRKNLRFRNRHTYFPRSEIQVPYSSFLNLIAKFAKCFDKKPPKKPYKSQNFISQHLVH